MIGRVITFWQDDGEYISPALPDGYGPWTDVTGESEPVPPGLVVIEVSAPPEWFDALPEGAVLWRE